LSYQNGAPAERLGRYELIGKLATGGMAEIHLARLAGEAGFEKIVVVKRLLPELVASRAYVEMFLGEAKLVAKLSHPNVCEVYELGREGAEYFLVMPFLDGVPATDLIARPRDPDRIAQLRVAAGVIAQACAGLHHAHELRGEDGGLVGLVHRDVSPSNVFVTAAGVVKVLDFGIAKVAGAAETEAGTVKGKSQYMAPEQLMGDRVDRRADIFGLGIVLYELATHARLFKRPSDYLAARAILEEPIPRADAIDPAVPSALADAIARALAREPAERFATALELAAAIEAALAPHGGIATPAQIAAALTEQHADELTAQRTRQARVIAHAQTEVTTSVVPRRRSIIPIAVGGVVVALGVGAFALTRPHATTAMQDAGLVATVHEPDASVRAPDDAADVRPPDDAAIVRPPDVAPVKHASPGWYSIDSTPFATIAIDDKPAGVTPLVHKSLAAGKHRVHAVLADGRTKDVVIVVPAGKLAAPIVLRW
jgi:eukaryotic-like serine/threonine-protein kinase